MRAGVNVDMIRPGQDLSGYKVVLAPDLYILPRQPGQAARCVRQGRRRAAGRLPHRRQGRDEPLPRPHAAGPAVRCPGHRDRGVRGPARRDRIPDRRQQGTPTAPFTAIHFADWIKPTTAEVLAGYKRLAHGALRRPDAQPVRQGHGLLRRHDRQGAGLLRRPDQGPAPGSRPRRSEFAARGRRGRPSAKAPANGSSSWSTTRSSARPSPCPPASATCCRAQPPVPTIELAAYDVAVIRL